MSLAAGADALDDDDAPLPQGARGRAFGSALADANANGRADAKPRRAIHTVPYGVPKHEPARHATACDVRSVDHARDVRSSADHAPTGDACDDDADAPARERAVTCDRTSEHTRDACAAEDEGRLATDRDHEREHPAEHARDEREPQPTPPAVYVAPDLATALLLAAASVPAETDAPSSVWSATSSVPTASASSSHAGTFAKPFAPARAPMLAKTGGAPAVELPIHATVRVDPRRFREGAHDVAIALSGAAVDHTFAPTDRAPPPEPFDEVDWDTMGEPSEPLEPAMATATPDAPRGKPTLPAPAHTPGSDDGDRDGAPRDTRDDRANREIGTTNTSRELSRATVPYGVAAPASLAEAIQRHAVRVHRSADVYVPPLAEPTIVLDPAELRATDEPTTATVTLGRELSVAVAIDSGEISVELRTAPRSELDAILRHHGTELERELAARGLRVVEVAFGQLATSADPSDRRPHDAPAGRDGGAASNAGGGAARRDPRDPASSHTSSLASDPLRRGTGPSQTPTRARARGWIA